MVRFKPRITVNDSAIARVKERLEEIAKRSPSHRVSVGVHNGDEPKVDYHGRPTGATLGEVAMAHEFGLGVPERSFIRSWFDRNAGRIRREMAVAERAEYGGYAGAVGLLAQRWASEIRQGIVSRNAGLDALEPDTVRQRERAGITQETPLMATGQLVNAIRAMIDGNYV